MPESGLQIDYKSGYWSVRVNPESPTPRWTPLIYHKTQAALWTCNKRFVAVVAGRGSGKTEIAKRRLVRFLPVVKPWEDPRYFYAAPTYNQAKRVAWHDLLALIPKAWILEVSRGDLVIRTIFGSELHIIGLDKPQRIEGTQWDGGVVDESCDVKPGTSDRSILPGLTWRNGWEWRIGVPKRFGIGASEFRDYFYRIEKGEIPGAAAFWWPSSDIVDPAILKIAQQKMDLKDYDEQFNASWVTASGGIFSSFDSEYNVRPCAYKDTLPIYIGSDFNVDPMAWVIMHRYPSPGGDFLECFDELYLRDCNTPKALDVLYQKYKHHTAGFRFFGDATGTARKTSAVMSDYAHIARHAGFKALGRTLHYLSSNPPQADKFASANALICSADGSRRFFVDKSCKHLIHDLESRAYKEGTREADVKQKMVGHISDAFCYVVHKLFPVRFPLDTNKSTVATSKHTERNPNPD
jgi:hypothetical protein